MKCYWILLMLFALSCTMKPADQEKQNSDTSTTGAADSNTIEQPGDYESFFKLSTYLTDAVEDTAVVQEFQKPVALMILPTADQVQELQSEYGEDFSTIADDASYYHSMAQSMLDTLGVQSVDARKPFVKFAGTDTTYTLDIRKKGLPEWNIIFFHPEKEPEIIPAIQLTEEKIKSYFEL